MKRAGELASAETGPVAPTGPRLSTGDLGFQRASEPDQGKGKVADGPILTPPSRLVAPRMLATLSKLYCFFQLLDCVRWHADMRVTAQYSQDRLGCLIQLLGGKLDLSEPQRIVLGRPDIMRLPRPAPPCKDRR